MTTYQQHTYAISRLHLDLLNPRVGRGVSTETEALSRLLERHGEHILGLARDIAKNGLNPIELWAVIKERNRLVVLEGNRRLVACRLLLDPGRAPATWRRRFEPVRADKVREDYDRAGCVLFGRRSEARHWIELKHHGLGNGEGTAPWGPEMVYLDSITHDGPRKVWNEFWYWMEDAYASDTALAALVSQAREEQYTTMKRLIEGGGLGAKIGARLGKDGRLTTTFSASQLAPFVRLLTEAMTSKEPLVLPGEKEDQRISSRTTNTASQAKGRIDVLWKEAMGDAVPDIEDLGTETRYPADAIVTDTVPQAASALTPGDQAGDKDPAPPSPRSRSRRPPKVEANLYAGVGRRTYLPVRLKGMLRECSRIKIEDSPEIASVMARIGVELAVDALIDARQIKVKSKSSKVTLQDKLKVVLGYLDPDYASKTPRRPELAGVWSAIRTSETDSGHLVKDLNDCIHQYQFTAALDIARRANKMLTPLIRAIAEEMHSAGVATGAGNGHP